MTTATDTALYLACLAPRGTLAGFDHAGIEDNGPRARTIASAGFDAIVVDVDPRAFDAKRTEDIDWLAPRASRHEAIVRAANARADVMPLGFGGVFSSGDTLARTLDEHREDIDDFFVDAAGCDEWSLKAIVDRERKIERARTRLAKDRTSDEGHAYLVRRKLDAEAESAAAELVIDRVSELIDALGDSVVAALERPVIDTDEDDGRWTVAHVALLVPRDELTRFDAALDDRGNALDDDGIDLELTGPWAPYSFVPAFGEEDERTDA